MLQFAKVECFSDIISLVEGGVLARSHVLLCATASSLFTLAACSFPGNLVTVSLPPPSALRLSVPPSFPRNQHCFTLAYRELMG